MPVWLSAAAAILVLCHGHLIYSLDDPYISLALGEYTACSGKDLLLAMIAAYEVQIRISWACSPSTR